MQKSKIVFLIPALISALAAIYMLLENQNIGFPDGHLTDLDKAMRIFYKIAIPFTLFFSVCFVLMLFTSFFKRTAGMVLLYCFSAAIVVGILVSCYLSLTLDNGIGG
jgi:hypothetical protein